MEILELPKNKGKLLLVEVSNKDCGSKIQDVIGKFSILSDKTFEEFIEGMYINADTKKPIKWGYMNYVDQPKDKFALCCNTSKESFLSLMKSQNIEFKKDFLIIKEG